MPFNPRRTGDSRGSHHFLFMPHFVLSPVEEELHISGRDVSAMRQGKDLHVYQYVRVVSCIMDEIHLEILLNVLLKELKNVFTANCDLVIGTIPHRLYGNGQPTEWVVVMKWDGVRV